MWTMRKSIGAASLAGLAVLGLAVSPAQAQFYYPGVAVGPLTRVGPPAFTARQMLLANYALNARAAMAYAPWMYGYNPAPLLGAGYGLPAYSSPYLPGMTNPYGGYGGGGAPAIVYNIPAGGYQQNNYAQGMVDPSNPYSAALMAPTDQGTQINPYDSDPYSGFLRGSADVIRAQGSLMMDQEKARLMRELAVQARLNNKKLRLDTENYIRDHTETFTQEQARFAASTLRRIQETASVGEVESGKSMNLLLKDLGRHSNPKTETGSAPLDEDVLRRINITSPNGANLGILRNDAKLNWPIALADLVPQNTRTDIENLAAGLYKLAVSRKLSPNLVQDLSSRVDAIDSALRAKVNDIPTGQYMDAVRFLASLRSAVAALQQPEVAPAVADWHKFIQGGKTAQEVAEWLNRKGLTIAPSTSGDEAAYHALHTALANYDIGANASSAASASRKDQ
jgi:hypothetical protein